MSKNYVHIFIKNYFIAKKCWPSSEPLVSCNFFAGGRSCLYADGCWRLRWLWQFLKIRQQWSLLQYWTLPFMNNLTVAWSAVWLYFTHSRTSFSFGVSLLKPGCYFYQLNLCNVLNPLLSFQQHLPWEQIASSNHFLCLYIRSNSLTH